MGALGVLNYFILCLGEFAHIGRLLPENTLENIVKLCLEYGNGTQVQSDQKADLFFDYELDNVMRDMCDNHFVLI